jgi:hypothetical protein
MSARSYSLTAEEDWSMAEPSAFPNRPTSEPADEHVPTAPATPPFLPQLVEDVRLAERVVRGLRANGDGRRRGVGVTRHNRVLLAALSTSSAPRRRSTLRALPRLVRADRLA